MWSADVGPFVPIEPEPAQTVENPGDHVGRRAFGVGVFDSQNEGAAGAACVQPVEERRAGAADVEVAGGGWSEPDAREPRDQDSASHCS